MDAPAGPPWVVNLRGQIDRLRVLQERVHGAQARICALREGVARLPNAAAAELHLACMCELMALISDEIDALILNLNGPGTERGTRHTPERA